MPRQLTRAPRRGALTWLLLLAFVLAGVGSAWARTGLHGTGHTPHHVVNHHAHGHLAHGGGHHAPHAAAGGNVEHHHVEHHHNDVDHQHDHHGETPASQVSLLTGAGGDAPQQEPGHGQHKHNDCTPCCIAFAVVPTIADCVPTMTVDVLRRVTSVAVVSHRPASLDRPPIARI